MELSQLGFLEELVAPTTTRRDNNNTWSSAFSTHGFNELLPTSSSSNGCWGFESFHENPSLNPSFSAFSSTTPIIDHRFDCPQLLPPYPFVDGFTMPELDDEGVGFLGSDNNNHHQNQSFEELERESGCKVEEEQQQQQQAAAMAVPVFDKVMCGGGEKRKKNNKAKKIEGQPSKNLMAERRRRKRLNDRLSMLRSIVPKISKMDRTSILGDTIDYMKELLERIGKLQEEEEILEEGTNNQINLLGISKEMKPNEVMVRNSPKFDIERREQDTRISICCATKPGLLLSTVNTLEALGLEIHQCVISSFNDFSMQASCSEVGEQRNCISTEEVKQALFRNAGYGGRCI